MILAVINASCTCNSCVIDAQLSSCAPSDAAVPRLNSQRERGFTIDAASSIRTTLTRLKVQLILLLAGESRRN